MAYEQRDNSGSVFKNDRKEKDSHPDRTGTAMIDGVTYYVSGWIKTGQKGQFLSLAFKRKEEKREEQQPISQRAMPKAPAPARGHVNADMDDDIPFAPEFR